MERVPAETVRRLTCGMSATVFVKNDDGSPVSRELHFTPGTGGRIEVAVQATGVNIAETLSVVAADGGVADSGVLSLDVIEGERCSVTVSFEEPYGGPIELLAVNGGDEEVQV